MKNKTSVVAVAMLIMGIFMLVGFAPLGVVLIIGATLVQASRSQRYNDFHAAGRAKAAERRRQQRDIAVKSLR